jgi:hypothetical protein
VFAHHWGGVATPTPTLSTADFWTDISRRRERFYPHLRYLLHGQQLPTVNTALSTTDSVPLVRQADVDVLWRGRCLAGQANVDILRWILSTIQAS